VHKETCYCFNNHAGYCSHGVYLFIYLPPQNEKIIREQRFHVLQDIDKNIHAKIDNSVSLMKNLLAAYEPGRDKRKEK
jgi:hypothetical protein